MKLLKLKLLVFALLMFAASSAFASYSYDITVDTSYLAAQSGNLSFQFNPLMLDAPSATATISGFSVTGGGYLTGIPSLTNASGNISSGSAVIDNTSGYNEYFHGITFGNSMSFHVDLSGTIDPVASGGSLFSLSLYNAAGNAPLAVANDPNGTVYAMNLNPDGSVSDVTPTPLPAAAWLLGSGLMGLIGIRRRKNV